MAKLTLISLPTCPYVQRAVIALAEKSVPFDIIYVDLLNKPDWFLALSPLGKVPVLKVERPGVPPVSIFESMVILEFVEETVEGRKLHPADPVDKARHRAWMEFGSGLLPETYRVWMVKDEEGYLAARANVATKLQRLEDVLGEGPFFAGADFSCVDTVFAPLFRNIDSTEAVSPIGLLKDFPKVTAWSRALAARESVKTAVPDGHAKIMFDALNLWDGYFMRFAPAGAEA